MAKKSFYLYSGKYEVDTEIVEYIISLKNEVEDLRNELREAKLKIYRLQQEKTRPKSLFSFLWR